MRKLIFIPFIHSEGDMLKTPLPNDIAIVSEELRPFANRIWSSIEIGISRLPNDLSNVKIFPEGTLEENMTKLKILKYQLQNAPAEERESLYGMLKNPSEEELELLKGQHIDGMQTRLVLRLLLRGVQIEATEGSSYREMEKVMIETARYFIEHPDAEYVSEESSDKLVELFQKRDKEIANNINTKLRSGETGILIAGLDHSPDNFLEEDIQIELIHPELREIISEYKELYAGHFGERKG